MARCVSAPPSGRSNQGAASPAYGRAQALATQGDWETVLQWLRRAYLDGFERPMDVVRDPEFHPLIEDSESRAALRDLLREFARESEAWMVRDEEPGAPIVVEGRVIDESGGRPIAGAFVGLVQADAQGRYSVGDKTFNPRLFASLRTDSAGRFRVHTIRPGAYLDDEAELVPYHIHFSIQATGYRDYNSEFVFDDDPLLTSELRREALQTGLPIAHRVIEVSGIPSYKVTIALQTTP